MSAARGIGAAPLSLAFLERRPVHQAKIHGDPADSAFARGVVPETVVRADSRVEPKAPMGKLSHCVPHV